MVDRVRAAQKGRKRTVTTLPRHWLARGTSLSSAPREGFIAALETLRGFDLGGFSVTYKPLEHNGSRFVERTVIGKEGKFRL